MRARVLITGVFFLFLLGCVQSPPSASPASDPNTPPRLCWGGETCVNVELAVTPQERSTGLMHRDHLDESVGMLFVFDKMDNHAFWMKNTLIPLDMVWIDSEWNVVDVQTAVPCKGDPCPLYIPSGNSLYVVEIASGLARRTGLVPGTKIVFAGILN